MFKKYYNLFLGGTGVIVLLLFFTACNNRKTSETNLELTSFAKELVTSFSKFSDPNTSHDSAFTYIIQCYNENIYLFGYSGFSHKDYLGKTDLNGLKVKIYGDENCLIYTKKNKTNDIEKNDIDGNYVEDLIIWKICIFNDTIFFSPGTYDKNKVYVIRDVCRKYFPNANIFWQRNSFRLDDIRM